jgi:integrase
VLPILYGWVGNGVESLREITRDQIIAALPPSGPDRAMIGRGLRSIFGSLKARKQIFTNPTSRVRTWSDNTRPPDPVDLDQVRAAVDSPNPARALLAALAAYPALRCGQICNLKLTDLRDGHLHIDGRLIPLAEPVRARLAAWLDYRQQRWPTSTNPHLFIHFRTAGRTEPVGRRWIKLTLDLPGGVQAIRSDRILHEAAASGGDPRRLCDLFGLGIQQALRYTNTIREPHLPDNDVPH